MPSPQKNLSPPDADAQKELAVWLDENAALLPAVVTNALSLYTLLLAGLAGDQRHLRQVLLQLRRALGILPSSEKRKASGDPIGATSKDGDPRPKDPLERLRLSLVRYEELKAWHKALVKKHKKKIKELKTALMKVEDIALTADELAECARENAEHKARLNLGEGADVALESPQQAFMQGGDVRLEKKTVAQSVSPELLVDEEIVGRMTDERTRYGFNLTVTKVTVAVEKVVVKDLGSTRIIAASTHDIGPPKMPVTWEFLANVAIMVAQYAMPFNRLGSLLTVPGKRFTSATLSRQFAYVAQRFVPIYLHNFRRLADARLLSGDDTTTRVLEYARFMKNFKVDPKTAGEAPWLAYATREAAEATFKKEAFPSLGALTARAMGFEFDRKDGNGQKISLQTTVMWGRGEALDPRSAIVFYRSHIGSFGNLLSLCLSSRQPDLKDLIVQSDLATVNLVSAEQKEHFDIEQAGCTSHARRPFAIHEDEDPDNCAYMLHLFKGLYIYEKGLDLHGRNDANVRAIRGVDSRVMWEDIKELATDMTARWSNATKLGLGARYIVRHYSKLTAYLENPIISISNDFSERMLRMENLIEANALFRNCLEGRFALDINRSCLQTAIAARAPLQDYVIHVLKASPEEVQARPQDFTAVAYAREHAKSNEGVPVLMS